MYELEHSAVPAVDMAQVTRGDGGECVDGRDRRRQRLHAVAREIAADVEREVGRERGEPACLGVHLGGAVVHAGDDEGRHLDVDARTDGVRDGLAHGHEVAAEPSVEILAPALEVDVHRIDVREEARERLRADRAVRDEDDGEPRRVEERRTVHDVLIGDERLVVGERDAEVAMRGGAQLLCEGGETRGRYVLRRYGGICRRDVCVLAERAGEIASVAADREDRMAGMKVVQRLFLDGVERERGQPPIVRRTDDAADVRARAAEPRLILTQAAGVGTEIADRRHACRSDVNRQMRISASSGMPAFLRAARSCSSAVSMPGAAGSMTPLRPRDSAMMP